MTPQAKATKLTELWKMMDESLTRQEFVTTLENFLKRLMRVEKANSDIADLLKTTMENVKVHLQSASDADFRKLRAQVLNDVGMLTSQLEQKSKQIDEKMALIKDGMDGKDADEQSIIQQVLAQIKLPEVRAPIMDGPEEIRDKLELLQDTERLDKSAIRGIEKIEEDIKQISIRPAGRVGGAKGFMLFVDGARKGLTAQHLNLIAGTGITLSYSYANGRNDVTISASGTVALSPISMTGTIDDTNVDFTAASEPTLVVVNGVAYRTGKGVTIAGTTITLDNPVGTGGDIYGL